MGKEGALLPSSVPQLVVLLLFVVPGFVHQLVRARLNGPSLDDLDQLSRILRAIGISASFGLLYLLVLGDLMIRTADGDGPLVAEPRLGAVLAFLGLFVLPALSGFLSYLAAAPGHRAGLLGRLRKRDVSTYDPTPTAWDFAFKAMGPGFVRVLTDDGRWVGGYFGPNSYASSFPQPREVFLEQASRMGAAGGFEEPVESTVGLYIRCDDVRVLELLAAGGQGDAAE